MNTAEMHVAQLEQDLRGIHKDLAEAAEWLADKMTKLAVKVRTEGTGASVNSLGECQSLSTTVDRLCAVRDAKINELARFRAVAERMAEEA